MGKTDYAYEYIKGKIISGEYPPLSDISEDTLQKELEVSRTPVREAILRLEKEDLVHVYPRKGTIVSAITLDLIEDVYGVRELIEPAMVLSYLLPNQRGRCSFQAICLSLPFHRYPADADTPCWTEAGSPVPSGSRRTRC